MGRKVLLTGVTAILLAGCVTSREAIERTYDCGEGLVLKVSLTGSSAIVRAGTATAVTLRPVHSTSVAVFEGKAGHRLSMTDGMATWQAPEHDVARRCHVTSGYHR